MVMPYFVASAPSVTVLRSLASTGFGKMTVNLPAEINFEDVFDVDAEDNEIGYVSSLSRTKRVGGMARRMARADVTIRTADTDREPHTNVEDVLDDLAERTSGDFYLETDIDLAGLGPWVPFVHFKVGDLVNVEICGIVVTLPVTRIEPVISEHNLVDWIVHVGGQLVSDDDARLAANDELRRAVVQDQRELMAVDRKQTNRSNTINWGLTGANYGNILDAMNGGLNDGALGTMNHRVETAQQRADDAWDASEAITEQGGLLDQVENDVQAIDNVVNGTSPR